MGGCKLLRIVLFIFGGCLLTSASALAGNIQSFTGLNGSGLGPHPTYPTNISPGFVDMGLSIDGLTPSVALFTAATTAQPLADDLFFINLVNNTGVALSRIELRLGDLSDPETFVEGTGVAFGGVGPMLFGFATQTTTPANPTTAASIDAIWSPGEGGTLHFSLAVPNADRQIAMWFDATPVPEPTAAMVLAAACVPLLIGRKSGRVEKPQRHPG